MKKKKTQTNIISGFVQSETNKVVCIRTGFGFKRE